MDVALGRLRALGVLLLVGILLLPRDSILGQENRSHPIATFSLHQDTSTRRDALDGPYIADFALNPTFPHHIATVGNDRFIRVHGLVDVNDKLDLFPLGIEPLLRICIRCVTTSACGRYIAVGGSMESADSNQAVFWVFERPELELESIMRYSIHDEAEITSIAISKGARIITAGFPDHSFRVWELSAPESGVAQLREILHKAPKVDPMKPRGNLVLRFNDSEDKLMISGSADGIHVLETNTWTEIFSVAEEHALGDWKSDSEIVFVNTAGDTQFGDLRVVDISHAASEPRGTPIFPLVQRAGILDDFIFIESIDFNVHGDCVVIAIGKKGLVWRLDDDNSFRVLVPSSDEWITKIGFTTDGELILGIRSYSTKMDAWTNPFFRAEQN